MKTNSTLCKLGETVTQIFHFVGGEKRTFSGIKTNTIKDGSFSKLELTNGTILMINSDNVLMIEVIAED